MGPCVAPQLVFGDISIALFFWGNHLIYAAIRMPQFFYHGLNACLVFLLHARKVKPKLSQVWER
jgi:hypothetical protein